MPLHRPKTSMDRWVALTLACFSIILAPLLMGGISPIMTVLASIPAFLGAVLCLIYQIRTRGSITISWFLIFPVLGLLTSLIALVPLPEGVLKLLLPDTLERIQWVTSILPDDYQNMVRPVLAVAPPLTALAVVRLAAGASVFYVISTSLKHQDQRQFLYLFFLAGYLFIFFIILAHLLFSVPHIWGLYTPSGGPIFYGPMINPNHMARLHGGFSLIFAACAATSKSRTERFWFLFGTVCAATAVFATLSRGGILFFGAAVLYFVVLMFSPERDRSSKKGSSLASVGKALSVQLVVLLTAISVLYLAREQLVEEAASLDDTTLESSKLGLYLPALRLLKEFWLLGVSPGGFANTFPLVLSESHWAGLTFTHVENIVLQTIIDHGLVIGAVFLGLGLVALVTILHRIKTKRYQLLLPALFFLVSADLLDFFLETSAGLFLVMGILGIIASHLLHHGRTRRQVPVWLGIFSAAGLFVSVSWSASFAYQQGVKKLDRELMLTSAKEQLSLQQRAMALYPHDGYAAYRLSHSHGSRNDIKGALQWANRSMTLWPNLSLAHIEAARALGKMGRVEQALIEYKIAWANSPHGKSKILNEVSRLTPSIAQRQSIFPEDEEKGRHLLCYILKNENRLAEAQDCFFRINQTMPVHSSLSFALRLALNRKDVQAGQYALTQLKKEVRVDGDDAVLEMRLIALQNGVDAALEKSFSLLKRLSFSRPLRVWQFHSLVSQNRNSDAFSCLQEIKIMSPQKSQLRWVKLEEAKLHLRANDIGESYKTILSLAKRHPDDLPILEFKIDLAIKLNAHSQAQATLEQIGRLNPQHPRLSQWATNIEGIQNSLLKR